MNIAISSVPLALKRAVATVALAALAVMLLPAGRADAAAVLTVESLTWDVIGLDQNDTTEGPNAYLVGARVCNTGDAPATDLTTDFTWDNANAFITLRGDATLTFGALADGDCVDAYYDIEIARDDAADGTTRDYSITASAAGIADASHSGQLLVEGLIDQARNDAVSIDGPTTVYVGEVVEYTLTSQTATAYDDLEVFLDFPNTIFRILSVDVTYTDGTQGSNDRIYSNDAGGDIVTTFTVEIVGTGTATMQHLIFDRSGGSFHYNSDLSAATVGAEIIIVNALEPPLPPDLAIDKVHRGTFDTNDVVFTGEYEINVENVGDGPTTDTITVTDTLPQGLAFVESRGDGWTCSNAGRDVTCTNDDVLAAGEATRLILVVDLDRAGQVVVNEAHVATAGDTNSANDSDSDTVTRPGSAPSLRIDKTAEPAEGQQVTAGDVITYTIVVTNEAGIEPTPAEAAVMSDPTPDGAAFVPGSATVDGVAIPSDTNPFESDYALEGLDPGESRTLTFQVRVLGAATGELRNVATASADNHSEVIDRTKHPLGPIPTDSPVPSESPSVVPTTPSPPTAPAVTLTKVADAAAVAPGGTLTYTLQVTGVSETADVTLADVTPAGTTYVAGSSTLDGAPIQDAAAADGNPLVAGLDLGTVTVGQIVTITQQFVVDATTAEGAVIVNAAVLNAPGLEAEVAAAAAVPVDATPGGLPTTGADTARMALLALLLVAAGFAWRALANEAALFRAAR